MTTVFVTGSFDILHGGHIQFFKDAKSLGDHLVVCVPTDRVIRAYKKKTPAIGAEDRAAVVGSIKYVDRVVVGDDEDFALNFRSQFLAIKPDVLAVTEDDQFADKKKELCNSIGCKYMVLPKNNSQATPISTSIARNHILVPYSVPLRIDIAGGWLDVPKLSRDDGYIVNVSIAPLVSLDDWCYNKCSGLGGSAAYAILTGKDAIQSEISLHVGWQDPAIISETGLVVWKSGPSPRLVYKTNPDWLQGKLYLFWTGQTHDTPSLVDHTRDYDAIVSASIVAKNAVLDYSVELLSEAINLSYMIQLQEGMSHLPALGETAKKYCGGGFGGYAVYLFETPPKDDRFVPVQPYMR